MTTGDRPVFTRSNNNGLAGCIGVSSMLILLTLLLPNIYAHTAPLIVFAVGLALWGWTRRMRIVSFYEDRLRIRGWRTEIDVPYSEVSFVPARRSAFSDRIARFVVLTIVGHDGMFRIPDYRLDRMKTDLSVWLGDKVSATRVQRGDAGAIAGT